jgi:hypothetical protein
MKEEDAQHEAEIGSRKSGIPFSGPCRQYRDDKGRQAFAGNPPISVLTVPEPQGLAPHCWTSQNRWASSNSTRQAIIKSFMIYSNPIPPPERVNVNWITHIGHRSLRRVRHFLPPHEQIAIWTLHHFFPFHQSFKLVSYNTSYIPQALWPYYIPQRPLNRWTLSWSKSPLPDPRKNHVILRLWFELAPRPRAQLLCAWVLTSYRSFCKSPCRWRRWWCVSQCWMTSLCKS